jgi:enoyl-CoA hydratase/carnithine racemase
LSTETANLQGVTVLTEISQSVSTVTMDWPETRNALDQDQIMDVSGAITHSAASNVRAIVLTGSGAFCSGANLRAVAKRHTMNVSERRKEIENIAQTIVSAIVASPIPVFAAIDGPAIGFGFDIALACDSRLIGPKGWCMQGWGRVGVIPGTGGELLLRLRNPSLLWHLLADQPRITGADAERWGIGEAVEVGTALEAAKARALAIARLPDEAIKAYVELSRESLRSMLPSHLERCADTQARLLTDPDLPRRIADLLNTTKGSI